MNELRGSSSFMINDNRKNFFKSSQVVTGHGWCPDTCRIHCEDQWDLSSGCVPQSWEFWLLIRLLHKERCSHWIQLIQSPFASQLQTWMHFFTESHLSKNDKEHQGLVGQFGSIWIWLNLGPVSAASSFCSPKKAWLHLAPVVASARQRWDFHLRHSSRTIKIYKSHKWSSQYLHLT